MAKLDDLSAEIHVLILEKALEDVNPLERARTCFQLALVSERWAKIVKRVTIDDEPDLFKCEDKVEHGIKESIKLFTDLYISGEQFAFMRYRFRQRWDDFIRYFMIDSTAQTNKWTSYCALRYAKDVKNWTLEICAVDEIREILRKAKDDERRARSVYHSKVSERRKPPSTPVSMSPQCSSPLMLIPSTP